MAAIFALIGLPVAFASLAIFMMLVQQEIGVMLGVSLLGCIAILFISMLRFVQQLEGPDHT